MACEIGTVSEIPPPALGCPGAVRGRLPRRRFGFCKGPCCSCAPRSSERAAATCSPHAGTRCSGLTPATPAGRGKPGPFPGRPRPPCPPPSPPRNAPAVCGRWSEGPALSLLTRGAAVIGRRRWGGPLVYLCDEPRAAAGTYEAATAALQVTDTNRARDDLRQTDRRTHARTHHTEQRMQRT